jgi:hypothetical protein
MGHPLGPQYVVLRAETIENLMVQVNIFLRSGYGYRCQGGVYKALQTGYLYQYEYLQAVVCD